MGLTNIFCVGNCWSMHPRETTTGKTLFNFPYRVALLIPQLPILMSSWIVRDNNYMTPHVSDSSEKEVFRHTTQYSCKEAMVLHTCNIILFLSDYLRKEWQLWLYLRMSLSSYQYAWKFGQPTSTITLYFLSAVYLQSWAFFFSFISIMDNAGIHLQHSNKDSRSVTLAVMLRSPTEQGKIPRM